MHLLTEFRIIETVCLKQEDNNGRERFEPCVKNVRNLIILQPQLPIHQASLILAILMKSFWQMPLPDINVQKAMMCGSRPVLTSMVRRLKRKLRQQVLHRRNL